MTVARSDTGQAETAQAETAQAEAAADASARPSPLLNVSDLTLRFGGVTALADVSFHVLPDELFAVIGPNGAGKTSIFNCLSAVYRPQAGSIVLDGVELVGARPARTAELGIGRTFQNLGLFTHLTLVDNLLLGRHHLMRTGFLAGAVWFGRARREEIAHRAKVEEVVDLLELGPHRREPVGLLPFGIQKRIELARALSMEPKLLLLDEPVAGMNIEETEDMARYILEVRQELRLPMVLVEHDMHLVMDIADRVMALDFGLAIATGTPDQVRSDPRVIEAYLGGSG
jgi:branched-chain amino acid transport system ATP-binding protein